MSLNKRLFIGEAAVDPTDHFNTVIYDGSNSDQSITGVGFQPDLVWVKCRDVTNSHVLADSVRGGDGTRMYFLMSDLTNAQSSSNQIETIDSDGFTVFGNRSATNRLNQEYVAWCFKAGGTPVSNTDGSVTSQVSVNNDLGFSIVTYTSVTGAGLKVGHGMDTTPDLVIWKRTDAAGDWFVYSSLFDGDYIKLNTTDAAATGSSYSSLVSSTLISSFSGTAGHDFVAYCFASKEGFSKLGTYTGTSASGNSVTTGFEPAFVLIKNIDSSQGWIIWDNKRGGDKSLFPFSNTTEVSTTYDIDFDSNGFTVQSTNDPENKNTETIIYLAFAAN